MISFRDLFWEKWCKFLEKERLESEKRKRDLEEAIALREQYKSYKRAELYQLVSMVFFYVVLFMVVYLFQRYVYGMYSIFIAILYLLVSALLVVGIGVLVISLTPSESGNKSLIGCDIL